MLFLAQTTPAPEAFSLFVQVLEVVGWFALIISAVVVAWKQLSGRSEQVTVSPSPLEVKEHAGVVTRAEWMDADTKAHGRMKRERAEIDARIDRVEAAAADRAEKLEKKIDANTSLTAEMNGAVSQMNQNVSLILTTLTRKS